jgi:hypothetical protein
MTKLPRAALGPETIRSCSFPDNMGWGGGWCFPSAPVNVGDGGTFTRNHRGAPHPWNSKYDKLGDGVGQGWMLYKPYANALFHPQDTFEQAIAGALCQMRP